jgi:hypothetical protein
MELLAGLLCGVSLLSQLAQASSTLETLEVLYHVDQIWFTNTCTTETLFCEKLRTLPVFARFDLNIRS